jgi:hypothetical protein
VREFEAHLAFVGALFAIQLLYLSYGAWRLWRLWRSRGRGAGGRK